VWWAWRRRRKELELVSAKLDLIENGLKLVARDLSVLGALIEEGHQASHQEERPVP
jgi:hypothetical protein